MSKETKQIAIESLLEQINDQFDYIAEIYVAHLPLAPNVSDLHITVHTDEAESFEEYIEITSADEVVVDIGESKSVSLPFDVRATCDGPGHIHGSEGTTVYMSDNVMGAKSRELDTGLSILRQKLAGVCPSCEESVETIISHYRDNHTCQRAERV